MLILIWFIYMHDLLYYIYYMIVITYFITYSFNFGSFLSNDCLGTISHLVPFIWISLSILNGWPCLDVSLLCVAASQGRAGADGARGMPGEPGSKVRCHFPRAYYCFDEVSWVFGDFDACWRCTSSLCAGRQRLRRTPRTAWRKGTQGESSQARFVKITRQKS